MVCKGIIQSIDYLENTCSVRLPIFESAGGGDMAVTTAIFSIIPGAANGYKENDVNDIIKSVRRKKKQCWKINIVEYTNW